MTLKFHNEIGGFYCLYLNDNNIISVIFCNCLYLDLSWNAYV